MTVKGEPLEIIEIDLPFCQEAFGVAPCTASGASGAECFNTFPTCQDTANFNKGVLTQRFSRNQKTGVFGQVIYPALQSVSKSPARIALGRGEKNLGALGKRGTLDVALKDFRWSDRETDPYVDSRSYEPLTQGTYFGRLRARHKHLFGIQVRRLTGYVGDTLESMHSETYILTEFLGPDARGNVQIKAQDPIKLTDDEFAQCPRPTNGKLAAALTSTDAGVNITLTPSGIGDRDYATSGRVYIGSEIASFTRSGDVMTLTARGLDGTTADTQGAGASVQQCYRVDRAQPADVIEDLLGTFAGVDAGFLPTSDWADEFQTWLSTLRLTRTIPKPRPVRELLSEIMNFGLFLWWDEVDAEFKVKVSRPAAYGETVPTVDDDSSVLERSGTVSTLADQRLTEVWIYDAIKEYDGSVSDAENFRNINVEFDPRAASANEGGQRQALEIYQPWLGQEGASQTSVITAGRLLARYRDAPTQITFEADVKDRANLRPGGLVYITTRLIQDQFGAPVSTFFEITSAEEVKASSRIRVTAQSGIGQGLFGFFKPSGAVVYGSATDAERDAGVYFSDGTNDFPDGRAPYEFF